MSIKKVFIIAIAVFTSVFLTTCKKVEVPTQPTNVTAFQKNETIVISCSGAKNATSYRIYRSATGKDYDVPIGTESCLGEGITAYFYDNTPFVGVNYYKVTAFNEEVESLEGGYATCNFVP